MIRILLLLFLIAPNLLFSQEKADTLDGWWTMNQDIHYFEDQFLIEMEFVSDDLFDMGIIYKELASGQGSPVQVTIVAVLRDEKLRVTKLDVSPQGCD
jgi:heptaprenylglyceryl phosphate synthase